MAEEVVRSIPGVQLHIAPFHKRSVWSLAELRDSIAEEGIIVPLVVRARAEGGFEIVCGVQRCQAGAMAGLLEFPCIVRDLDDEAAIAIQVAENRMRTDIHPMDEALYCEELATRGLQAEAIAKRLEMKKRDVARRLRLIALCPAARAAFIEGRFDEDAALSLAGLTEVSAQRDVLAALDAGALCPEEVTSYIERTFSASLDDVPWRKSDEKLLPQAGACTSCPKRSDVQRDLFPRERTGVHCLDVSCYRAKMETTWRTAAAKPDVTVHDQPTDALFMPSIGGARPRVLRSSGMVDADEDCPHIIGHNWREAVDRSLKPDSERPVEYIARDHDGRPRYLFREVIVSRIVRRSDAARQQAAEKAAEDPVRPDDAPSAKDEGKIRRVIVHRIAEAACLVEADTWQWVAERVVAISTARSIGLACELLADGIRGLSPAVEPGKQALLELARMSNRQARRVATAVLIFDEAYAASEISDPLRDLAATVELDIGAVEREIRRPS